MSDNLPARYTPPPQEPETVVDTRWVRCGTCKGLGMVELLSTSGRHQHRCIECDGEGFYLVTIEPLKPVQPPHLGQHRWKYIAGKLMTCLGGHRAEEPCTWVERSPAWDPKRDEGV